MHTSPAQIHRRTQGLWNIVLHQRKGKELGQLFVDCKGKRQHCLPPKRQYSESLKPLQKNTNGRNRVNYGKGGRVRSNTAKSKPREGFALSHDFLEGLWYRMGEQDAKQNGTEMNRNDFNLQDVLDRFPNLANGKHSQKTFRTKEGSDAETQGGDDLYIMKSDGKTKLKNIPIHHPLAQEAQEKLDRVLGKIETKFAQGLPNSAETTETFDQIRSLLVEEFETVIGLWLQPPASQTNDLNNTQQEVSIDALNHATHLMKVWEKAHVRNLKQELRHFVSGADSKTSLFCMPAPSNRAYQNIIDAWHTYYSKHMRETTTKLNRNRKRTLDTANLIHSVEQSTTLLESMVNRLLANREHILEYQETEYEPHAIHIYSNMKPLNEYYAKVIWMWTYMTEHVNGVKGDAELSIEFTRRANQLLMQSETLFHDGSTVRPPSYHAQEMELWSQIHPTRPMFNQVLFSWSRIARMYQMEEAAEEAEDVIKRMESRYTAYIAQHPEWEGIERDEMFRPSLASYKAVLGAWSTLRTVSAHERAEKVFLKLVDDSENHLDIDVQVYNIFLSSFENCASIKKKSDWAARAALVIDKLEEAYLNSNPEGSLKPHLRPTHQSYNSVLAACSQASREDGKTLQILKRVYADMFSKGYCPPASSTYVEMIKAGAKLNSSHTEKEKVIQMTFSDCCDAGMVNKSVLFTLMEMGQHEIIDQMAGTTTGSTSKKKVELLSLPPEWSRNVKKE
jgi:hypothetical protein